jgi:multisubunit Na+/H+ antiporter MnhG subunit
MLVAQAVCAALAVLIVAYAAGGAFLARSPLARLHFLAPVTTLAVPLLAVASVLSLGVSLGSASIIVTAAALAVSGPALTAAVGRSLAAEAGADVGKEPE